MLHPEIRLSKYIYIEWEPLRMKCSIVELDSLCEILSVLVPKPY